MLHSSPLLDASLYADQRKCCNVYRDVTSCIDTSLSFGCCITSNGSEYYCDQLHSVSLLVCCEPIDENDTNILVCINTHKFSYLY